MEGKSVENMLKQRVLQKNSIEKNRRFAQKTQKTLVKKTKINKSA